MFRSPEQFNLNRQDQESRKEDVEIHELGPNRVKIIYGGEERAFDSDFFDLSEEKNLKRIESIEIETSGGKINLAEELPPGWKIFQTKGAGKTNFMAADPFNRYIIIPEFFRVKKAERWIDDKKDIPPEYEYYENEEGGRRLFPFGLMIEWKNRKTFSKSEDFIRFLHEVGHSHQYLLGQGLKIRHLAKEREKKGLPPIQSFKEAEDYHQQVIAVERGAWAFALREYRRLKERGIDLLPEVESNEDVLKIVKESLENYLEYTKEYYKGLPNITKREWKQKRKTTDNIVTAILEKLRHIIYPTNQ